MKKLSQEQKDKIKAGLELLCEENTTLDKLQKLSELIKDTSALADKKIKQVLDIADRVRKIQEGDVIYLSLENLSEDTPKKKDRKKLLLLLLKNWKDLQSEIERIHRIQETAAVSGLTSKDSVVKTGKTLLTMKGPLGAVTIIAAGIVALTTFLNNKAVNIEVKNYGCSPISTHMQKDINIPGLKLPSEDIISGERGQITIPGIDISVDLTKKGGAKIKALNFSKEFNYSGEIKDIIYDGKSLMGKNNIIKLGESKDHELIINCGSNIKG